MNKKDKLTLLKEAVLLVLGALVLSVLLFGCTTTPVETKVVSSSECRLPASNFHTALLARYPVTLTKFSAQDSKVIVDIFNATPPRTDVDIDYAGIYIQKGKDKGLLILISKGCVVATRAIRLAYVDYLLNNSSI